MHTHPAQHQRPGGSPCCQHCTAPPRSSARALRRMRLAAVGEAPSARLVRHPCSLPSGDALLGRDQARQLRPDKSPAHRHPCERSERQSPVLESSCDMPIKCQDLQPDMKSAARSCEAALALAGQATHAAISGRTVLKDIQMYNDQAIPRTGIDHTQERGTRNAWSLSTYVQHSNRNRA
jgi:hypothetical protein